MYLRILCALIVVTVASGAAEPSHSYLLRVAAAVQRSGGDENAMRESCGLAADRLVKGGKLWGAGDAAFVSELCGRAGGLMLINGLGDAIPAEGDVVMFSRASGEAIPEAITKSGALVIAFGNTPIEGAAATFSGYPVENAISPTLANIIPAWIYTGQLIGACVVRGKMPITFETIGLPGGYPRIYQYQAKGVFWQDFQAGTSLPYPPSIDVDFAAAVVRILKRVDTDERAKLDKAGEWAAAALKDGKNVYIYGMGHFVPDELSKTAIGERFKTGVLNSGFTATPLPDDEYGAGDVVIHIGYQHPPYGLFERAVAKGAKLVYVDLYQHRDWKDNPHVIWIDPMWPWDDAVVKLEGYDILMLPPSGIVNSAIAWEIYQLATKN